MWKTGRAVAVGAMVVRRVRSVERVNSRVPVGSMIDGFWKGLVASIAEIWRNIWLVARHDFVQLGWR